MNEQVGRKTYPLILLGIIDISLNQFTEDNLLGYIGLTLIGYSIFRQIYCTFQNYNQENKQKHF